MLIFHFCCFQRLQNQVGEVVDVMQNNVSRVMERGDKLEDLQDKSGKMQAQVQLSDYTILKAFNIIVLKY